MSSSSDEIVEKIIKETLKSNKKRNKKRNKGEAELKEETLPSLRNIDEDSVDQTDLDFQRCIAKKLAKSLEKELSKVLTPEITDVLPQIKELGGIKLLNSSQKYIKLKYPQIAEPMKRVEIKKRAFEESLESLENKCKVVAVDSDYILNKTDVKSWSDRSKAPVYRYKKERDGTLVLQEAPFTSINYK